MDDLQQLKGHLDVAAGLEVAGREGHWVRDQPDPVEVEAVYASLVGVVE